MAGRAPGTDRTGALFDDRMRRAVWEKALPVIGVDRAARRKDRYGAWIEWSRYGVSDVFGTGWEIDHLVPVCRGGSGELENLQPLQWQNNRAKGDDHPANGPCAVTANE